MDPQRFDHLTRLLATRGSRRLTLKSVLGGLFAARLVQRSGEVQAAEDEGCCRCIGQIACQIATSEQACETVCGKGKGIFDKYATCENNKTCQPKPDADGGCCYCLKDKARGCNNLVGKKTCMKFCGTDNEDDIHFSKKNVCELAGTGTKYTCHSKPAGENASSGPVDLVAALYTATTATIDGVEPTAGTLVVDLEQGVTNGYFTAEQGDQLGQLGWVGTYYSYWFVPKDGVPYGQAYSTSALWRFDIFADTDGATDHVQRSADALRSQPDAIDHSDFFGTGAPSHYVQMGVAYTQADGTETQRESFTYQLNNLVASCQIDGIGTPLPPEDAASVARMFLEHLTEGTSTYPVLGLLPIGDGAGPIFVNLTKLDGQDLRSYGLPPEYQELWIKLAEGSISQVNAGYTLDDVQISFSSWTFDDPAAAEERFVSLAELLADIDPVNSVQREWIDDVEQVAQEEFPEVLTQGIVGEFMGSRFIRQPQPDVALGGVEVAFRIDERFATVAVSREVPAETTLDSLGGEIDEQAFLLTLAVIVAILAGEVTYNALETFFGCGGFVDVEVIR